MRHIAFLNITWRELYDNLNSLRFALATVLLLGLMLTNAVVHLREHPERVKRYRESVSRYQTQIATHASNSLYDLAQEGPGDLHKKPSDLRFCAEGNETFMSDRAQGGYHRWSSDTLKSFWILAYPSATPNRHNVRPAVTRVDWGFIIGYVLSLVALLFTFDSISGERERGTLRLTLANAIPRHTVLIGKFLGAFISVSLPFILAVLVNLLVVSTSPDVHLDTEAWGRLGIIFCVAMLYICLFLALGMIVSARVQRSAVSLVVLLLIWVVFVVFMPSTLASIAGESTSSGPTHDFSERSWKLHDELGDAHADRHWAPEDSTKKIELDGAYVTEDAEQQEQLHAERLNQQLAEVQRARTITRISPVTIVQNLLESFAGTGFERHLQFLESVQTYAREFRTFIVDTDRADPESLHIFGVRAGMSKKPVTPDAVPRFEDTLNLSKDFNTAAMEFLLLTLFVLVLLSGAYLAFVRVEV